MVRLCPSITGHRYDYFICNRSTKVVEIKYDVWPYTSADLTIRKLFYQKLIACFLKSVLGVFNLANEFDNGNCSFCFCYPDSMVKIGFKEAYAP